MRILNVEIAGNGLKINLNLALWAQALLSNDDLIHSVRINTADQNLFSSNKNIIKHSQRSDSLIHNNQKLLGV